MVLMNEVPENLQGLEVLMREAWEKLTPDYIAKSCLTALVKRGMEGRGVVRFTGYGWSYARPHISGYLRKFSPVSSC